MKNLNALLFCLALAACGGSSSVTTPASITPPPTQPPTQSANAIQLSNADITISTDFGDYLIQAASGVNVTIPDSSNYNVVDFSQNQSASGVEVGGNFNTLIFRGGTSASSVSVTGNFNTLWVPASSPIVVSGVPDTTTTWNNYTP